MKKRFMFLAILIILIVSNQVLALTVGDNVPIQIQTVNSSGGIVTGTFEITINISNSDTCSPVLYSNITTKTTDSRGIVSYNLENVNLSFDEQYWFCYYRDGVLKDTTKIARTPYAFKTKNITLSGVEVDSNLDMTNYNVTADTGFFSLGWSYLTSIPNLIYGLWDSNNLNDLLVSNGTAIGYNQTVFNDSVDARITANEPNANVNDSDYLDGYDSSFFMPLNTSVSGNFDFNGGWQDGGVTIDGGDIYVQTGYFYNITSLNVTKQNLTVLENFIVEGNVGIGTTNLLGKLTVKSSGVSTYPFYIAASDGSSLFNVYEGGAGDGVVYVRDASGAAKVGLHSASDSFFTGGDVGIGTSSPYSKLSITGGDTDPSLNFGTAALVNIDNDLTDLAITIDNSYPYTASIQHRHKTVNSYSYPIALNPLGGYVGIGTDSPEQVLDVRGVLQVADSGGVYMNLKDTTGTGAVSRAALYGRDSADTIKWALADFWDANENLALINYANADMFFYTNSALQMTIKNDGDVGIGTSTPSAKLDVAGGVNLNNTFYVNSTTGNVGIGTDSPLDKLHIIGSSTTGMTITGLNGNLSILDGSRIETTRDTLYLGWNANTSINLARDNFFINGTSGNVGIGTSSPGGKLEVVESYSNAYTKSFSAAKGFYFFTPDDSKIGLVSSNTGDFAGAGTAGFRIGGGNGVTVNASAEFIFEGSTKVTIKGDGNVGIGTSTPSAKLDVAGGVNLNNTFYVNSTTGNVGIGTTTPSAKLEVNGNIELTNLYDNDGSNFFDGICTASESLASIDSTGQTTCLAISGLPASAIIDNWVNESGDTMIGSLDISSGNLTISSGYVGIGTATPSAKLDVEVSSGGAATIGSSLNTATGDYAVAIGGNTNASGDYSTAMGYDTTASGSAAIAMGLDTTTLANYATAIGWKTTASGQASIAMGYNTTASGHYATSIGYSTIASGLYSTAMGMEIKAGADYVVAIGLDDMNGVNCSQANSMCIMGGNVGIGTATPSHTLNVVGNVNITGNLTVGGLGAGVPANTISAFYQTTCPTGWILADGTSGTPDLRGIFVRGAGTSGVLKYANDTLGYFNAAYGEYMNDSFQGHFHRAEAGTSSGVNWASGSSYDGTNTMTGDPIREATTDGSYGTPRVEAETAPASLALIYCMKTSEDSQKSNTIFQESGGDVSFANSSHELTAPRKSYDTGWINRADWTNVHLGSDDTKDTDSNITHNLNAPLSDILVKVLISTDGTDANSFEALGGMGYTNYGLQVDEIDDNNVLIQTGTAGIISLTTAGVPAGIVANDWYYKIKVWYLG